MAHLKPFQLLEINIISAQDLELVSKSMRTYATAWVHPKRKLSTSVDTQGHHNPTWNDKFVFRVDEEFLRTDTSAVMIEIYAVHWLRDTLVGTVRVLVGNLIPPPSRLHHQHHVGMRFVALQVRRPSGRPQGILNIGVAVLDSSMRSMPLYTQLSASAVGYRDLMEEDYLNHHGSSNQATSVAPSVKPILRRSKSERSDRVTFDDLSTTNGSIVGIPQKGKIKKASSMLSGSESTKSSKDKKGKQKKARSVLSAAEFREKTKEKGKKSKASSVIGSIISRENVKPEKSDVEPSKEKITNHEKIKPIEPTSKTKQADEKPPVKKNASGGGAAAVMGKPVSKYNGFEYGGPKGSSIVNGKYIYGGPVPVKAHSLWSDSEVGPSPSEVAAAVARERQHPIDDNQSSVLDGWSLDESVEGLRSKLERWRTELPPLYDRGGFGGSSFRSTSQHIRRHSDDGETGLFSCFGNIYGYECQCVCGKPPEGRRSLSSRFQSPSASAGRAFV
ncbi:hypothetical protein U1Q18_030901 [Sarracenia purpurea var. burkii]